MASQTQPSGLDRKRKGTGQRCGISCRVGIDGLVVWGGALAITGLMAIFTVRKTATKWKRRNGSITTPEESAKFSSEEAEDDNEERKKGLGLALLVGDCTGSLIQTDARHEQRLAARHPVPFFPCTRMYKFVPFIHAGRRRREWPVWILVRPPQAEL